MPTQDITQLLMSKEKVTEKNDEIVVNDPQILRPKVLPLVIELPESASAAQVEFAKVLNAYAYKNPEKWAIKKPVLLAQLKALKNAQPPVEDPDRKLTVGTKNKLP